MPEDHVDKGKGGKADVVPPPEKPQKLRREIILNWLIYLRIAATNTFFIVLTIVILVITTIEMFRKPVIIEEIALPTRLSDLGYSGSVAANRLWDAILEIYDNSDPIKSPTIFKVQYTIQTPATQLDVIEPNTGLSLQSITQILRQLFGLKQTRIAGEFICGDLECTKEKLALRLRVITSEGMTVLPDEPMGAQNIDDYLKASALKLLKEIDPYIVAAYYYRKDKDPGISIEIARNLIADNHPHAAWAANLLANDEYTNGNYQAAIKLYESSVELAKYHKMFDFEPTWHNWGSSLAKLGRHEEAIEMYEIATQIDSKEAPEKREALNRYNHEIVADGISNKTGLPNIKD